ncbi:MAG: MarR family transcriptional regulator [Cellulosilyticum sp.]|nr:MarR family transcriptional regulator [Cellulosilyticum sp.]
MIAENLEALTNYLWHESTKKINTLLAETDFNISDYYYLTAIANMNHPNFGDVAQALNLTKPAISALIKRLMHHELIEKVQCQEDKRVFYLSITEKGKAMIEGDHNLYARLAAQLSSNISPAKLEELDYLLDTVVSLLSEETTA